jgi:hypothetical protein
MVSSSTSAMDSPSTVYRSTSGLNRRPWQVSQTVS